MKRLLLILFTVSLCTIKAQDDPAKDSLYDSLISENPIGMTVDQFNLKIKSTEKPILVYFTADWCIVCKREKPVLKQLKLETGERALVYSINMESNPLLAEYFEIDSLPTFIVYKDGHLTWSAVGFQDKEKLLEQLRIFFPKK